MAAKRITDLPDSETITGDEFIEVSQVSTTIKVAGGTISAAAADNSYSDSAAAFLTAGFVVGDRVNVIGFSAGVNNIAVATVTAVTAGKMTIGGTEGDAIVDEVTGPTVTIAKWISRKALTSDIGSGAGSGLPVGGTIGQVLTKQSSTDGDADWETPSGGGGGGKALLDTVTVGVGGQATISFTSIAGTYEDLEIVCVAGSETNNSGNTDNAFLQFNGDTTGANYDYTSFGTYGSGSPFANSSGLSFVPCANTSGVPFGRFTIVIPGYADGLAKAAYSKGMSFQSNVGICDQMGAENWTGTAAISQIDIKLSSGVDFKQGSVFRLYGVD